MVERLHDAVASAAERPARLLCAAHYEHHHAASCFPAILSAPEDLLTGTFFSTTIRRCTPRMMRWVTALIIKDLKVSHGPRTHNQ